MRAVTGLLRPVQWAALLCLQNKRIEELAAHRIAASGLTLVPEGRQVFPDLTVPDNILLRAALWRSRVFCCSMSLRLV
jgi:ABC-type branched-subunit amino acid transport system ATPase component